MVSEWMVKNPLSFEERKIIKEGIVAGLSSREIGLVVQRCHSTILREAKRLGNPDNYDPEKAQEDFERKQRARKTRSLKAKV